MLHYDMTTDQATAEIIWYHALAIGYSPFYLTENTDGIRQERSYNKSIHQAHVPRADDFTLGLDVHTELHHLRI